MEGNVYQDPKTGRWYRVDPTTGASEWVDAPPQYAQPGPQPGLPQQPWSDTTVMTAPTQRKRRVPGWAWGLGGLLIGIMIGSGLGGGGADTTTTAAAETSSAPGAAKTSSAPAAAAASEAPKSEPAETERVIVIKDVRTFGDAFDANQVKAEKDWGGKRVQLTATVANIKDDHFTMKDVTSKDFSLTQISCELRNPEQALELTNDTKATAIGTVDDQRAGVITLKDCVVK